MLDPWITDERTALLTDLYQLTMMQAYWREGLTAEATFDLFVRRLPEQRNYLLACGLDDALRYLESLRFTDHDLRFLNRRDEFEDGFIDYLRDLRFTGTVRAVPEGTVVFATEPLLEVTAPLPEAQLVETYLLNQITFQTVVASKAARVVHAADGRGVVDFGMRRMHGTDAAMKGARAVYLAGCSATSNVRAGATYGIPIAGTMAHSYIEVHDRETDAFDAFARLYPGTTVLVDTYDTLEGVRRVIRLAADGLKVGAIRLDSGDLAELARHSRVLLDEAGLGEVRIFASGGLDEFEVERLVRGGAPIDGFGVGTRMGTSADAPTLDSVYKLVAYAGEGRMKLSEGKETLPGAKQVFRSMDGGRAAKDVIALVEENLPGQPLLEVVMTDGVRTEGGRRSLATSREHARASIASLPSRLHALQPADPPYEVRISDSLANYAETLRGRLADRHTDDPQSIE